MKTSWVSTPSHTPRESPTIMEIFCTATSISDGSRDKPWIFSSSAMRSRGLTDTRLGI